MALTLPLGTVHRLSSVYSRLRSVLPVFLLVLAQSYSEIEEVRLGVFDGKYAVYGWVSTVPQAL